MFCEKELSKYKAPTLLEIYIYMKEIYKISELDPEKISELEWQIDYNLMVPRKEVCEIFIKIKKSWKRSLYCLRFLLFQTTDKKK